MEDAGRDLKDIGALQYEAVKLHDLRKLKVRLLACLPSRTSVRTSSVNRWLAVARGSEAVKPVP